MTHVMRVLVPQIQKYVKSDRKLVLFISYSLEEIVETSLIIRRISLQNRSVAVKNPCQQEIHNCLGFPFQKIGLRIESYNRVILEALLLFRE